MSTYYHQIINQTTIKYTNILGKYTINLLTN